MVNAKGVAFKVNKQTPISHAPLQAYGTVINCRKLGGKRAVKEQKEVQSHYVAFTHIEGTLKRKRGEEEEDTDPNVYHGVDATISSRVSPKHPVVVQRWQPPKPPRSRKIKLPSKGVDLDCWFTILSFSDPAQLLLMRSKISSCYRFLNSNPMLWKHSRTYHYGNDLPEPPSELTEFEYADLRHDHGCMFWDCKTPNTRKTYWAFLRRWCKPCLGRETIKEQEMVNMIQKHHGEDCLMLQNCLPSGIFDSWGNFVGVGPATTHALKTVYRKRDVEKLIEEYSSFKAEHGKSLTWDDVEQKNWYNSKLKLVEERKAFAHKMEGWEEMLRNDRTYQYSAKKAARKTFFQKKASELSPAISVRELECCPSYKRAVAIPKDPNNTSWLQLKPKLEKEAAELKAKGGAQEDRTQPSAASSRMPSPTLELPQPYRFPTGFPIRLGFHAGPPPSQIHMQQGASSQAQAHSGTRPPPPQSTAYLPSQSHLILGPPMPQHHMRPGLPPPHSHLF